MKKNVMIFVLVKSGFHSLKPADKVTKARDYVTKMTDNATYPTPTPALTVVTTDADALGIANQNLDGSHINISIRNQKEAALDATITALGGYVQAASNGDKVKIESAGFETRNPKTPPQVLGPVTDLTIKLGKLNGTANFKWKSIKGTKLYVVMGTTDMNGQWDAMGTATKAKITLEELVSGTTYYFRVICINAAGRGPESEVISIKAY